MILIVKNVLKFLILGVLFTIFRAFILIFSRYFKFEVSISEKTTIFFLLVAAISILVLVTIFLEHFSKKKLLRTVKFSYRISLVIVLVALGFCLKTYVSEILNVRVSDASVFYAFYGFVLFRCFWSYDQMLYLGYQFLLAKGVSFDVIQKLLTPELITQCNGQPSAMYKLLNQSLEVVAINEQSFFFKFVNFLSGGQLSVTDVLTSNTAAAVIGEVLVVGFLMFSITAFVGVFVRNVNHNFWTDHTTGSGGISLESASTVVVSKPPLLSEQSAVPSQSLIERILAVPSKPRLERPAVPSQFLVEQPWMLNPIYYINPRGFDYHSLPLTPPTRILFFLYYHRSREFTNNRFLDDLAFKQHPSNSFFCGIRKLFNEIIYS